MISLLNIMRALADPTRLRIVFLVRRLELSVGELVQILDQSQPRVSRHIRILDEAGLLERRKEGSWVFLRPSGMLTDGSLSSLLAEADMSQAKAFQRDLLRLDEVRNARTDMAAQYFAAHADEWDSLRSLHIADSEVEARLAQVLQSAPLGQVLDVGTGTGRIVELFAADSSRLVAIDSSPEMLRLARAKIANLHPETARKIEIKLGDFNMLPVGDGEFDTVIFHQVLHYAQHPEAVIAEAIRTLAPGGRLVIVDFAAHDLEELRTVHAHARLGFSDDFMRKAFTGQGLQMVHQTALAAGELVVKVWMGEKPSALQPLTTPHFSPKNNLRIVA
ncbi:metalloregulator ArsR/SmtB family transcription factor [Sphingorhabdus sp. EL138]|uniref:ArsR/SmtB family transcription factor n=1 Tax=Sphingorhabdus sp. EL138 TaxID=2073156 RepID=UPI0025FE9939|nr:metalloregulator ArsR/SmtB family transcription factor [Sphingorhabdus sp. EL138]